MARAAGAAAHSAGGIGLPCTVLTRMSCGLEVKRPKRRSGLSPSTVNPRRGDFLPGLERRPGSASRCRAVQALAIRPRLLDA